MGIKEIRKELHRKPWRPLEFALENGDRFVINHPENIFISLNDARLLLYDAEREWVTSPEKVTSIRRRRALHKL